MLRALSDQPGSVVGFRLSCHARNITQQQLTGLAHHLARCTRLQTLDVQIHPLLGENFIHALAPLLQPGGAPLELVTLKGLTADACSAAATLLSRSTVLRCLRLDCAAAVPGKAGTALAALLRSSSCRLSHLAFGCTRLIWDSGAAVRPIAEALAHNTSVQVLDISGIDFDADDVAMLARGVHDNASLRSLTLYCCQMDVRPLFTSLGSLRELRICDLQVEVTPEAAAGLGDALGDERSCMQVLKLDCCSMPLLPMAPGLRANASLTELILTDLHTSDAEVSCILDALSARKAHLIKLKIHCMYAFAPATTRSLALAVQSGALAAVETLSLKGCAFGDASVELLCEALSLNARISKLRLDECAFGPRGAAAVARLLQARQSLASLTIDNNPIIEDGALVLADALHTNTTLSLFSAQRCRLGTGGLAVLRQAVAHNARLVTQFDEEYEEEEEEEDDDDDDDDVDEDNDEDDEEEGDM